MKSLENELCSFNLSVTSPTSQLILQPFHCFTYVTPHYPTLLSLLLRHRLFTCVTGRDAHEQSTRTGIGSHVLNEVSQVWRCRGSKYTPLPQWLHLQRIVNYQVRTLLAYLLGSMFLSKQTRKRTFQESWEKKYFCCAQDDNVRCLLCSKVQKVTHKWNIKVHYDTVLCSKSAADAANLSIFTLRHVHCGLRCATSSWGHIEYMIADACTRSYRVWRL